MKDASSLFGIDPTQLTSLIVADAYYPPQPVQDRQGGPYVATSVEFEAHLENGEPCHGALYTKQDAGTVAGIIEEAARTNRPISITAHRCRDRHPSGVFWLKGEIAVSR